MFEFFDRVYCIHLPNPGRRSLIEQQFERVGMRDVTYVHAAQPPQGFTMSNMRRSPSAEFGVNLSQIKAVMQAIDDGAEHPLFVEDDIVFHKDAGEMFIRAFQSLPFDWDVLYFGGHPRAKAQRVSEHLAKVGAMSFAEAYSIRRKALTAFVDYWFDRIGKPNAMYDFILGEFAAKRNSYCTYPLICEQPPGMSQISGTIDDKRDLVRRGWANNLS